MNVYFEFKYCPRLLDLEWLYFCGDIHQTTLITMSSLLAIHLDAVQVIVLSIVIIWVLSVGGILFGLNKIKKINLRDMQK